MDMDNVENTVLARVTAVTCGQFDHQDVSAGSPPRGGDVVVHDKLWSMSLT